MDIVPLPYAIARLFYCKAEQDIPDEKPLYSPGKVESTVNIV
jgi:hypothetical protein